MKRVTKRVFTAVMACMMACLLDVCNTCICCNQLFQQNNSKIECD